MSFGRKLSEEVHRSIVEIDVQSAPAIEVQRGRVRDPERMMAANIDIETSRATVE